MPKLVFATVGTSVIENCIPDYPRQNKALTVTETVANDLRPAAVNAGVDTTHQTYLKLLEAAPQNDAPRDCSLVFNLERSLPVFERKIGKIGMIHHTRKVSAEVASLLVMSKEQGIGEFTTGDEIWLLPSDTPVGLVCAEANQSVLQNRFPKALVRCTERLEGVRFVAEPGKEEEIRQQFLYAGLDRFEEIIAEKTRAFKERHKTENPRVILDITGGFKGLMLFAPILCLRHVDELFYFYQEATRPVSFQKTYFLARIKDQSKKLAPDRGELASEKLIAPGD